MAANNQEVPENEVVDTVVDTQRILTILASYIEKHPEDADKWLNFYNKMLKEHNVSIPVETKFVPAEYTSMYFKENYEPYIE
jgi:hypothetical protein